MLLASSPIQAQDSQRVSFPRGDDGATLTGRIRGYEDVTYLLGASAGQQLRVEMSTSNASAYFNVTAPGADAAMFIGSSEGSSMTAVLPTSGDYRVQVYLMRNAARRNEVADYTVSLRITGAASAGDYADGDAGGPDFWKVTGLATGDTLNLRAGPSTGDAVLGRLLAGAVVRNLGCRGGTGQRWCKVESGGLRGWVAGRYLRETASPAPVPPATRPRPVANGVLGNGEPFTATGKVPCAINRGQPTGQCAFGVIRPLPNEANLWIAMGNGKERYILFQGGIPAFTDADAAMTYEKDADLFLIRIGTERYEIPEAVLNGG
ncbi:SH3 domain-containing protein [Rhodobacter ferrooxidans]|nr:SH3 domain-containing protein [Rhodobacter sp. SW2]